MIEGRVYHAHRPEVTRPEIVDHIKHVDHVQHVDHIQHVDHKEHEDHIEHVDHILIEDHITQSDLIGELAYTFALCALFLYAYTAIGCYIFRPSFIRQLAYILQTIRISLTLATLLPCVLHWQAYWMFPIIPAQIFPFVIMALLVLNIMMSSAIKAFSIFLLDRFQKYNDSCTCKQQHKPHCGFWSLFQRGDSGNSKKKKKKKKTKK